MKAFQPVLSINARMFAFDAAREAWAFVQLSEKAGLTVTVELVEIGYARKEVVFKVTWQKL